MDMSDALPYALSAMSIDDGGGNGRSNDHGNRSNRGNSSKSNDGSNCHNHGDAYDDAYDHMSSPRHRQRRGNHEHRHYQQQQQQQQQSQYHQQQYEGAGGDYADYNNNKDCNDYNTTSCGSDFGDLDFSNMTMEELELAFQNMSPEEQQRTMEMLAQQDQMYEQQDPMGGQGEQQGMGGHHHQQQQQQQQGQINLEDLTLEELHEMSQMEGLTQEQQMQIQAQMQLLVDGEDDERPEEHFLTIALNGTILGATEMVTGFPPSGLLMTSAFDSVHEDDLLGMHAIKTHFWERDQPDVEVYLRRRTIEGDWIWLVAKVVSYIDSPVPGIIVHEAVVKNENVAVIVSRITRIASLLLQAVESSLFGSEVGNNTGGDSVDASQDEAVEIQAMLLNAAENLGIDLSNSDNPLRELMEAAANGDSMWGGDVLTSRGGTGEGRARDGKKSMDIVDHLKSGAALDLSKIILTEGEVKLVTLVLTGRLQIEDLGPLLYLALNSPEMDLVAATDEFYSLSEQQLKANSHAQSPSEMVLLQPPPLAVINLSFTDIGDYGMETLSEFLYADNAALKTLDVGFCNISPRGMMSLCQGLKKRNMRCLPPLQGLIISGNTISYEVAVQLGIALSAEPVRNKRGRDGRRLSFTNNDDDCEGRDSPTASQSNGATSAYKSNLSDGLKLLYMGSTSISPESLNALLSGLGPSCPLQELRLQSNRMGPKGATRLVEFLETKSDNRQPVLPKLHRLDMSYNELGDQGTSKLTRAISKRAKVNMTEVSLSGNYMGSKGIENIMNKLLQHKLITLNLDNNSIGDQGCQLVAASLPSIGTLTRLNLAFNDIGCRGVATLMRSLVGCESITSLGLSGNVMRISGAIAMGFTLAQHPRLSVLELDNCCLSQVAQCHIVAGIISNRWVPMKVMYGFRAGPPMVAIGALEIMAQHMSNEECFRLRRDIQMKTLLKWMENNRASQSENPSFLTNDDLSRANDMNDAPSQSAYLRMLDWLGRIPFDESELMDLRKYFYDVSDRDGEVKSDMNLKHRGDILAALASDVVEEILETDQVVFSHSDESVGLDLDKADDNVESEDAVLPEFDPEIDPIDEEEMGAMTGKSIVVKNKDDSLSQGELGRNSMSTLSANMSRSGSQYSTSSASGGRSDIPFKARITMFPQFAAKLDNLKAVAQEMMDNEEDPHQQDVIAQQFAEASLTILRQLRYHCMESGLDGWRQGKLRRKVLIVDDSVVTRKMVARAFEKANFIVDTAENGVEGVNKMKESIYDIAFMDIDMPVMNGFDATKALRIWEDSVRPGARQPICALTAAHVDDFDRSELMKFKEAGLDVMESKPCNIPRLFKVVDDVSPMFSDLSINAIQSDNENMGFNREVH